MPAMCVCVYLQCAQVPTLELDHTFESKEDIAHTIRDNLRDVRAMNIEIDI